MFARFDENPAMTVQDIKETKRYGRTHAHTQGQRENSIPTTNKVCGGIKIAFQYQLSLNAGQSIAECFKGNILQYFQPTLSYHLSLKIFLVFF